MKRHIIFTLLCCCTLLTIAKHICHVTLYDENSGMAQQHVTQIMQDRKGMMWFATWNGLNRFDGYDFECFKTRPGDGCAMPTDRIRNIVTNSKGDFWCLVDDRVFLFDLNTYRFTDISTPLERRLKRDISVVDISSLGNGTSSLKCKNGSCIIINDKLPIKGKIAIENAHARHNHSISTNKTWALSDKKPCKVNYKTTTLWFNLYNHALYVYRPETKRWKKIANIQSNEEHESVYIHEDEWGALWFIAPNYILSYYDETSATLQQYDNDGAKINDFNGYFEDKQHNLWLRSKNGVYKICFENQPATDFPQKNPSQIRCFFIDSHRRYWVTSKEDKTVRIFAADNHLIGYLKPDGKLSSAYTSFGASIYCITEERNGTMWLGSKPDGLFRLTPQRNESYTSECFKITPNDKYSINCNSIYDLKQDRKGRLWIATLGGGINCIPNTREVKPIFINNRNCFINNYPHRFCSKVRALHITNGNTLLAATTEGLLIADIGTSNLNRISFQRHFRDANREESLSNDATMNILEDHLHHLFICTESGGVNQIISKSLHDKTLNFKHYTTQNGLTTDVVLSMYEYKNAIWLVGDNKIMKLNPNTGTVTSFDIQFWKTPYLFSDAIPLQRPDGQWLFGHYGGAFTVSPQSFVKSHFAPRISLTGLTIQNRETDLAVDAQDTLTLLPSERNITVHFAALDYSDGAQISYAFRLIENQSEWSYIHKGHSATFLDMKPGTYTLEIRSTNSDGQWVNNIRRLTIIVKPTFWETGWAILLYILLSISVICGIFYLIYYIKKIVRQRKEIMESYLALLNEKPSETKEIPTVHPSKPQIKPEDDAFMKRVLSFVDKHLDDSNASIDEMASAAATSRSGLNRKMKSIVGMTPIDFLNEARIQKACRLLTESELHVADIAFTCGFSDPKYFSRCFKKATDMTPSEYREKH